MKVQRNPKNLGFNNTRNREGLYLSIEKTVAVFACRGKNHEGDRVLPIRSFYLNGGGIKLQYQCIDCQKRNRSCRITRCRKMFQGKSKQEVCDMYISEYGPGKKCSICKDNQPPSNFPLSITMETGLHNHCYKCAATSQGNGGIRDFIFMPDKDNISYMKDDKCILCGSSDNLSVDHIVPISKGGVDRISNKQTLCRKCNSSKHNKLTFPVSMDNICERYRDASLDLSNMEDLSPHLSKKVDEFRLEMMADIRYYVKEYLINNNMGADLNRTVDSIILFYR